MKNLIFFFIFALFASNISATNFQTIEKTELHQFDKGRKRSKPTRKASKKRAHKARKNARKHGLVTHGCRGLKAHPNHNKKRR